MEIDLNKKEVREKNIKQKLDRIEVRIAENDNLINEIKSIIGNIIEIEYAKVFSDEKVLELNNDILNQQLPLEYELQANEEPSLTYTRK